MTNLGGSPYRRSATHSKKANVLPWSMCSTASTIWISPWASCSSASKRSYARVVGRPKMKRNSTSSDGQSGMTFSRRSRRRSTLSGAEKMPIRRSGAPEWSRCGQPIVCGWGAVRSAKSGSSNEREMLAAGVCSTSYWSSGGRSIERIEKEKRTPTTVERKQSARSTVRALDLGMRSEYQGRRRGGACEADDAADGPVNGCDACGPPPADRLRERKLNGERG
jgi:hypothetical protein